jgi:hypothetical protein
MSSSLNSSYIKLVVIEHFNNCCTTEIYGRWDLLTNFYSSFAKRTLILSLILIPLPRLLIIRLKSIAAAVLWLKLRKFKLM